MTRTICMGIGTVALAVALMLPMIASGQGTAPLLSTGYSLARETNLVGTVSSVVENGKTSPLGTHVMVQTPSGLVDVHVGSAKYLASNNLNLAVGDNVRIIGELFTTGPDIVFLARLVQKGTAAVAVRSPKGMPLWRNGTRLQKASQAQSQSRGAL
jgi:hypothetical protein